MTAGDLAIVLAAVLCSIGFAALIVVLVRVLDALRAVRLEVEDLRSQTRPLIADLQASADDARASVDEARSDLERFDKVLGSAEAIGDAVSGRVARTAFSSPMIKATGFARGTSRTIARLRGAPNNVGSGPAVLDIADERRELPPDRTTDRRRSRRGQKRRRS